MKPALQFEQEPCPLLDVYFPVWPITSSSPCSLTTSPLPAEHRVGAVALAGQYDPAGH